MNFKKISISLLFCILLTSCNRTNKQNTLNDSSIPTIENIEEISGIPQDDMFTNRDMDSNYNETSSITIKLMDNNTSCNSNLVSIDGNTIYIKNEGEYYITGTLTNGNIIIEALESEKIQLILDNVSITSSTTAPIYIKEADKVFITLAENSNNTLENSSIINPNDIDNIDSIIFSKSDLTLNGVGSLKINSCNHGIVSKDDLVITQGIYEITSTAHAICGKNSVRIQNGTFNLNSGNDSIHSEDLENSTNGFVYLENGNYEITSIGDAISSSSILQIINGNYTIVSKAKGLKATSNIILYNGYFDINSTDDSIHSNSSLQISNGTIKANTTDDGIHSDSNLVIIDGNIDINNSYEGLESQAIDITGGIINILSNDDGINAGGGVDNSGSSGPIQGGSFNTSINSYINISGGEIKVNASGDGIDSNGSITVSGGTTLISGPTNNGNASLDYDKSANITGGIFIACGSSGMAQGFSSATQGSILYNFSQSTTESVILYDSNNNVIILYSPEKSYTSVVISCPDLTINNSYKLSAGSNTLSITLSNFLYSSSSSGTTPSRPGGR